MVSRWSPSNENPTKELIETYSKLTGIKPDQKIDLEDPVVQTLLLGAIMRVENSQGFKESTGKSQPPKQENGLAGTAIAGKNEQRGSGEQKQRPPLDQFDRAKQAPPAAVEALRKNPQLADQFKAKYGYLPEYKPLPNSKDQLVEGESYMTKRGPATYRNGMFYLIDG